MDSNIKLCPLCGIAIWIIFSHRVLKLLSRAYNILVLLLFFIQGFTLEDATGLAVKGNVQVHSVYATSLPTSHPSFSPQRVLDFSEKWKAHFIPKGGVLLFIGVLSATNHFAERMAVRKTWMQSLQVKESKVAVRFFVALVRQFFISIVHSSLGKIC